MGEELTFIYLDGKVRDLKRKLLVVFSAVSVRMGRWMSKEERNGGVPKAATELSDTVGVTVGVTKRLDTDIVMPLQGKVIYRGDIAADRESTGLPC